MESNFPEAVEVSVDQDYELYKTWCAQLGEIPQYNQPDGPWMSKIHPHRVWVEGKVKGTETRSYKRFAADRKVARIRVAYENAVSQAEGFKKRLAQLEAEAAATP